jgi:hypothetical protein
MVRTGRCLCGEVRYELEGELAPLVNCHCRHCRRAHASAFTTCSWLPRSAFRFTAGDELIGKYMVKKGFRCFCERCGTRIFNGLQSGGGLITLVVATLDEEPTSGPIMHINLESKAPWYEITDDLPQHQAVPPGLRERLGNRKDVRSSEGS